MFPPQLAALHAADPDGSSLTDLSAARLLAVRQGKCISEMVSVVKNLEKKLHESDVEVQRQKEIQEMLKAFMLSGGRADNKTWLAHAESAKESMGPKGLSVKLLEDAVQQTNITLKGLSTNAKVNYRGFFECQFKTRSKDLKEARDELAKAQERLNTVRLTVAEKVGHKLVSDVRKYGDALEDLVETDPEQYRALTRLVRSVANRGPLKKHSLVQVEVAGNLAKARVEEEVYEDDTEVAASLWTKVDILNKPYEEGYDTCKKDVRIFPRNQIIGGGPKPAQRVTDATVEIAIKNSAKPSVAASRIRDPKRPEFLVGLYCDAAASRGRVLALAEAAKTHIAEANLSDDTMAQTNLETIVPGLKCMPRACVKTAEKYGGCYANLTDLCRMTFVCFTVEMAIRVIEFIRDHPGWALERVKDRLDPVFDASGTGGYRDLLINARDKANGHIVELQLTFKEFYDIKTRGGYATYKLARLLELNEKETTDFEGKPTEETLERIRMGILRSLNFSSVPSAIHDALLTEEGLLSRTCAVTQYCMYYLKHKPGQQLDLSQTMPLPLLHHIGRNLTKLMFSVSNLVGSIPETIGEYCVNLLFLDLNGNKLEGEIPESFLNFKKLQTLILSRNKLCGSSWTNLCQLTNLQNIWLFDNPLTGEIPEGIGKCNKLQKLLMSNTDISGPIPESIGHCKQLKKITLHKTHISGTIPASIGQCTQLKHLRLDDTDVSGVVPASLAQLELNMLALDGTQVVRPKGASDHPMWVQDDPKAMRQFLSMLEQS